MDCWGYCGDGIRSTDVKPDLAISEISVSGLCVGCFLCMRRGHRTGREWGGGHVRAVS
jgi:hypothetical protein